MNMKKGIMIIFTTIIILSSLELVSAVCTRPILSRDLNASTKLCGNNFVLNNGLVISKDNVNIDCSSAVINGAGAVNSAGIFIEDRKNVVLRNCKLTNYDTGVFVKNSSNIVLKDITLLRNNIGVRIIDSLNVNVLNGFDISLKSPVKLSNSFNSTLRYVNKKIKSDFCAFNYCNK